MIRFNGTTALLLALAATPAFAAKPTPNMPAGEFLNRAEPLLNKGMAKLVFSGEARALAKTLGQAAENQRTRLEADRAARRPVTTCLPPKGKATIVAGEFLGYLRNLPPQEKTRSLDRAVAGYMARKYPCSR
jgi:hypothetical protein